MNVYDNYLALSHHLEMLKVLRKEGKAILEEEDNVREDLSELWLILTPEEQEKIKQEFIQTT